MTFMEAMRELEDESAIGLVAEHPCRDLYAVIRYDSGLERFKDENDGLDLSPHHLHCTNWHVRRQEP